MRTTTALQGALVATTLATGGCCMGEPWTSYPERTPPDEQYIAGGVTHGYEIYVWECLRGQRVVVYDYKAEWSCESPKRQTAPCGTKTPIEVLTASDPRRPMWEHRLWR